jgi:outer membrane protein TolC
MIVLLFVGGSIGVSADVNDRQALTWQDCVREALLNHPDILSAQQSLRQARADQGSAQSGMLPQISAEMSARRSGTSSSDTSDAYAYSVSGRQLVFDGFKTSNVVAESGENLKAAEYDVFVVSSNVRLNLRRAFAQLLMAQDLVNLTELIETRRAESAKLVKLRYDAGREHQGSLLTAEANLAKAQFEVEQARRNLALSQTRLAKALGRRTVGELQVFGEFLVKEQDPTPDFESLADNTPSLGILAARKDAARYGINFAKADFFPEIYLSSSAGRSDSSWPPDDDQWSAGLTVSLPLFEGGNRIHKVTKAEAKFRQAEEDARSGRDTVVVTLQETWTDLQDAVGNVGVQKKFLGAAEERAKIANAQYSSGLISFDDWIIIEDNLVSARKTYLSAQAGALTSEAAWVQAKGGTLNYD